MNQTAADGRWQMGQQNDKDSGTLKYFGSQLKLFRDRAGLSRVELGIQLGYSKSTIASIEQGRRVPQQKFVERADEVLGADGVLRAGMPYLLEARFRRGSSTSRWWRPTRSVFIRTRTK